jgi:hypothetical protein
VAPRRRLRGEVQHLRRRQHRDLAAFNADPLYNFAYPNYTSTKGKTWSWWSMTWGGSTGYAVTATF